MEGHSTGVGGNRSGAGLTPETLAIGTRSSMGKQVKSYVPSQPFYGFGTGTRETQTRRFISNEHNKKDSTPKTPGPGAYQHQVATGKQSESKIRSTPSHGFGTSKRWAGEPKFKVPGPGEYLV